MGAIIKKPPPVIVAAVLVAVVVGSVNSYRKHQQLPGMHFYLGNAALAVVLTWFYGAEPQVATSVATAYATFVVLGEGGGMIDHFTGPGTSDDIYDTQP